ncbi:hypothetical protein MOQ72_39250 [Saccharopolyspora sp. K220]|uniref:hypothetical protein n=1 Tax=Saccharopolyspora soli TaxID=2926618 RepID=UPI001F58DB43|nr:hypothetical protein [Saccharopolyspora soli]MCI2423466.1 hypothetical protein [Saccharopolyspora soli]
MESWLRPHLDALRASVQAGFRFLHLPSVGNVLAVQGMRVSHGAMDMFQASAADDAIAARFRIEDLELGSPPAVWHKRGPVADVVPALLELPPHDSPGAPRLAGSPVSDLWLPGDALP